MREKLRGKYQTLADGPSEGGKCAAGGKARLALCFDTSAATAVDNTPEKTVAKPKHTPPEIIDICVMLAKLRHNGSILIGLVNALLTIHRLKPVQVVFRIRTPRFRKSQLEHLPEPVLKGKIGILPRLRRQDLPRGRREIYVVADSKIQPKVYPVATPLNRRHRL